MPLAPVHWQHVGLLAHGGQLLEAGVALHDGDALDDQEQEEGEEREIPVVVQHEQEHGEGLCVEGTLVWVEGTLVCA